MHLQYCAVFIDKTPSVGGPVLFKPVLFKDHCRLQILSIKLIRHNSQEK